jgi:hypothetical protein
MWSLVFPDLTSMKK